VTVAPCATYAQHEGEDRPACRADFGYTRRYYLKRRSSASARAHALGRCVCGAGIEFHKHIALPEITHLFDVLGPTSCYPMLVRALRRTLRLLLCCAHHDYLPRACVWSIIRVCNH
jgi:hypothetical protein